MNKKRKMRGKRKILYGVPDGGETFCFALLLYEMEKKKKPTNHFTPTPAPQSYFHVCIQTPMG